MMRRVLILTLAPAAGLMALAASAAAASGALLINESPSLPEGVYRRAGTSEALVGDIVAVEPPPRAREYLTGLGMPPSVKLLKRVGATEGQTVCAVDGRVRLKDRRLVSRTTDRRGVALPRWSGCRTLADSEIFVVGDSANSFDSRYFGPVGRSAVAGVYREVLRW
jgi:conjugative transfer signal peptidase TraF